MGGLCILLALDVCQQVCFTRVKGIRTIGESVDGADMPKPPYKGKACNHPNAAFVSLFRPMTVVLER